MSVTDSQIVRALEASEGNKAKAARALDIPVTTLKDRCSRMGMSDSVRGEYAETITNNERIIEYKGGRFDTVEEALAYADVDQSIWEVDRIVVNGWDVTMKMGKDKFDTVQNKQIKIWLKRITPKAMTIERLLKNLESKSPIVPLIKTKNSKKSKYNRAFEVFMPDPHYGMRSYKPSADADQTPESMVSMMLDVQSELVSLGTPYGPFEQIIFPLGNDFYHSDNVWHTTTGGTGQPEADSYLHTFISGEELAIELINRLKPVAPVVVYMIPGNHDRTAAFALGRVLRAYFLRDKNVTVHADESPYKFHQYGVNLIGYEHGHSVQPTIRLAALMANECPEAWAATKHGYREWHLGDQHRKGTGKPSVMEEQGVSVEYMPGLVAPNEWHRIKSYNWQKRGAMGFVWDYKQGPIARVQVNIDRYLNTLMGR